MVAASAAAQPSATNAPVQPQSFSVIVQPGEFVGATQITRDLIQCGTNQFSFVLPPELSTDRLEPRSLRLISGDGRFYLTFRLLGTEPAESEASAAEARKARALGEHPHTGSVEEFPVTVANRSGYGLAFRERQTGIGERRVRLAWVPCKAGTLEFTLNSDPKIVATALRAFESLLLTFRSNETGRLEVIRFSAES